MRDNAGLVCELIGLSLITLLYSATVVISAYAWWGDPSSFGFNLTTRDAFEHYYLKISFATWTHAAWIAIYVWQAVWILYAWTFAYNLKKPDACKRRRTLFPGLYPAYMFVCGVNIGWVYSWGNRLPEISLGLIVLLAISLWVSVGMVSGYLYVATPDLPDAKSDLWMTRLSAQNGLAAFASWATLIMLYNLGAVLQEDASLHVDTTATILLSLISAIVLACFLLETTILDRFLRYSIAVYPVVMWTLGGVFARHWDPDMITARNHLFVLVLMCVVGLLFIVRIVLLLMFACLRPIAEYHSEGEETVPF